MDKKDIFGIVEILWFKLFLWGLELLLYFRIGEIMIWYVDFELIFLNE